MNDPSHLAPTPSALRWFGLLALAFFGLLGGLVLLQFDARGVSRVLWGFGAAFALVYYAIPPLRRPMYAGWMAAVAPLGWLVSHLVLGAIFYGVITPIGVVMRLFGRDRMARRFDASSHSYWAERAGAPDPSRYFRQS